MADDNCQVCFEALSSDDSICYVNSKIKNASSSAARIIATFR